MESPAVASVYPPRRASVTGQYARDMRYPIEDSANLPDPDVIAAEIVEDLEAALEQFAVIANDLKR